MTHPGGITRVVVAAGSALVVLITAFAPPSVVACTCSPLANLQEWVERIPEGAMVVGHVVRDREDGSYDLAVERWYGGTDRRPNVVIRTQPAPVDGVIPSTSCGGGNVPRPRLLFYGTLSDDDVYHIGGCSLEEDPASAHGQALERHAIDLIGPAEVPAGEIVLAPLPAAEPAPRPPEVPDLPARPAMPFLDPLVVLGMVGIAVLVLFGTLVAVARRRRDDRT